jgi:arsenate reductase (glutaredoxin)
MVRLPVISTVLPRDHGISLHLPGSTRIPRRFRFTGAAARAVSHLEIWINPACSKWRSAIGLLDTEGADYTVRRHLEDVPSEDEIRDVLARLGLEPWDITRTQEAVAKKLGMKEWARIANRETVIAESALPARPRTAPRRTTSRYLTA